MPMPQYCRSAVTLLLAVSILVCSLVIGEVTAVSSSETAVMIGADHDVKGNLYDGGKTTVSLTASDAKSDRTGTQIVLGEEAVVLDRNESRAVWTFEVDDQRDYRMVIRFISQSSQIGDFEIRVLVNGVLHLPSAEGIKLARRYKDAREIRQDKRGNDIRPIKEEEAIWIDHEIKDARGIYNEPLDFRFEEGVNTITVEAIKSGFAISEITLYEPVSLPSYDEYINDQSEHGLDPSGFFEQYEAEHPYAVSNTVLYATYDKSNAATSPSDPLRLKLNTIGQSNWKMPGQWIEWKVDIPEDGFYNIGLRVRQNYLRGYFSTRTVTIDGKLLFDGMRSVRFPYSIGWNVQVLGEDESGSEPWRFYLNKGEHIIRMEAVPGVAGAILSDFDPVILDLNTLYRKMIMITGISPDQYRDYQLHKDIPGLIDDFRENEKTLRDLRDKIGMMGIRTGSDAVVIEKLASQLESFIDKPDSIALRLEDFRNNISSVSSWLLSLKEQPLEIDYIFLTTQDIPSPRAKARFWDQLNYRIRSLIGSFFYDYSMIGDTEYDSEKALNVWVNLGRDQSQIIKDMAENQFVSLYDVPVNISLVQQGLTEAIAAGKGPDIALYTGVGESVNFAARGALLDISEYSGFEDMKRRFLPESWIPFYYEGGVYGVPLQQGFNMMFCRTDIFDELGILPPETWDEFYDALIIIQKSKLLAGIPVGTAIAPDNSIFDMLLYQRGGEYYDSERSATELDSETALAAFKQWTDFYSKYSLPISYDFYNRFRSGEMPLGIAGYTMYNMLSVAAPEIEGLWRMLPVPGTLKEDGTYDRTTTGGLTGLIVLKGVANRSAAFTFIDWYTGAQAQIDYGLAIENVFGQAGRYDTANLEALKQMNWTDRELASIEQQLQNIRMTPQIPASYYVTRSMTNAFRSVVISGQNPRESLYTYNKDMNEEIARKRLELGIDGRK